MPLRRKFDVVELCSKRTLSAWVARMAQRGARPTGIARRVPLRSSCLIQVPSRRTARQPGIACPPGKEFRGDRGFEGLPEPERWPVLEPQERGCDFRWREGPSQKYPDN